MALRAGKACISTWTALVLVACAAPGPAAAPTAVALQAQDGDPVELGELLPRARLTVLIFFGRDCVCQTVHRARIAKLAETMRSRSVQFFWIDSERHGSPMADAAESTRLGLTFPMLVDPGARLADSLDARYATYSVVLDSHGSIRYRGGIDGDGVRLHDDAVPYLRNAVDDLLAGRPPRMAESSALGCALQTW